MKTSDPSFLPFLQDFINAAKAAQDDRNQANMAILVNTGKDWREIPAVRRSLGLGLSSGDAVSDFVDRRERLDSVKNMAEALRQCGLPVTALWKDLADRKDDKIRKIVCFQFDDNLVVCPDLGCAHIGWPAIEKNHPHTHALQAKYPNKIIVWPSKSENPVPDNSGDPEFVANLVEIIQTLKARQANAEISAALPPPSKSAAPKMM